MVTVHNILRCDTLFSSTNSYRHTMLVGTTYEEYVPAFETEVTDIDIGRDVNSGKVTYVNGPVRIRKGAGDKRSLEFFCHI